MNLTVIVMISTLVLPGGDSGVHIKTFANVASCITAADIEATDPFVRAVECAELQDGVLTLRFAPEEQPDTETAKAGPTG